VSGLWLPEWFRPPHERRGLIPSMAGTPKRRVRSVTGSSEGGGGDLHAQELDFSLLDAVAINNAESTGLDSTNYMNEPFDRYASIAAMQTTGSCVEGNDCYNALPGNGSATAAYGDRSWANNDPACTLAFGSDLNIYTPGRSGGKCLEFIFPVDFRGSRTMLTPQSQTTITFGPHVVVEWWVCIPTVGESFAPDGAKFCEMSYASGNNRMQFGPGMDGGRRFHAVWGDNPGPTGVNRQQSPFRQFEDGTAGVLNDGEWHRMQFHFKANTTSSYSGLTGSSSATETYSGTSSQDGYLRMFIDGDKHLSYDVDSIETTPAGGDGYWCYEGDVDMIPGVGGTNAIPGGAIGQFKYIDFANQTDGGCRLLLDDMKVAVRP
jgi:hypothetical protein